MLRSVYKFHACNEISVLRLTESACCRPVVRSTAVDALLTYRRYQHSSAAAAHCAAVVALVLRLHALRPSLYRDATVKARSSCLASLPEHRVNAAYTGSDDAYTSGS
jgi:hypothetical protein